MVRKVQIPVVGGIRKVVTVPKADVGTTIAQFAGQTLSLAQLRALLGITLPTNTGNGNIGPPGQGTPPKVQPIIQMMMFGDDGGGESSPGPPGNPGTIGTNGIAGGTGPAGPAIFMTAEPGEDGWPAIPGNPGPAGNNGTSGGPGPMGPTPMFFAEDGQDGGIGPPGQIGPAGAAGSGSSTPLPGVTPNLVFWLRGDLVIGDFLPQLPNSGYLPAVAPVTIGAGATGAASTLNSLPVINFPATSAGGYNFAAPNITLHNSTVFVVFNPTLAAAGADFISGGSGAYEWGLSTLGKLELTKALIAVIGDSTTILSSGVWVQANVTYNDTTGAWAMRIAQAADASGTNIQGITAPLTTFGYNPFSGGVFFLNGLLAELIVYNRVLSPTEITNIEAYLHTKWGV